MPLLDLFAQIVVGIYWVFVGTLALIVLAGALLWISREDADAE